MNEYNQKQYDEYTRGGWEFVGVWKNDYDRELLTLDYEWAVVRHRLDDGRESRALVNVYRKAIEK